MIALMLAIGLFCPNHPSGTCPEGGGATCAAAAAAKDGTAAKEGAPKDSLGAGAQVHRGAAFALAGEPVSLDTIADDAEKYKGQTVKVTGKVTSVCKSMGCWMTITGAKPTSKARIAFKDHGFFVPKDGAGATAIVEGTVEVKAISEDERKHLAEDAKASIDTIPKVELRVVASGVELSRAAP